MAKPALWNRELSGYIAENELHNSVWFYGEGPINLGAMFATKSTLQDAVKSWSLKLQRQFRVLRSSKEVYTVVCETKGCNFRVHAHVPKYKSYWVISTLEEHNCMLRNMRFINVGYQGCCRQEGITMSKKFTAVMDKIGIHGV
ncbi:hypothetical protein E2562_021891 [Oryza meyeriana var. granulata]|uniref:Transposase MuDR plant domain-containing protein n=1 Tax=Oryza meyeriana var. granulata TaxID=110450 RepID=A0A6G1C8P3_9ORYZ|nr:hypothetical protein E2562_021891 [Oryza meyeriana var. granulata]